MDLILTSILNFHSSSKTLSSNKETKNKVQAVGMPLEDFIKNLFLVNSEITNEERIKEFSRIFSWLGSSNNPPDLILKNSYAIEVKKLETINSIALNSSFPKNKISSNDSMISKACGEIEGGKWEKELFYYIGVIKEESIKQLCVIDAKLYCADSEVYSRIKNRIKEGILEIDGINFEETNELGKVKNIDPYKITDLRIRGMWNIKHPLFYLKNYLDKDYKDSVLFALIEYDRYCNSNLELRKEIESKFNVEEKNLPNPNNLARIIKALIITSK